MKFKQHLEIGNKILDTEVLDSSKINRAAYLFGNVAPDFNCVYPAHRLKTTEKRFMKRLKRMEKASTSIVRSFTLGVITHYICDYFCYAHNIESLGVPHKKYETNLYNYYEAHMDEIGRDHDKILKHWLVFKDKSKKECMDNECMSVDAHCEFIISQVKYMNSFYLGGDNLDKKVSWTDNISQIRKDMEYSYFMIIHTIPLILEPFKCVVGNF